MLAAADTDIKPESSNPIRERLVGKVERLHSSNHQAVFLKTASLRLLSEVSQWDNQDNVDYAQETRNLLPSFNVMFTKEFLVSGIYPIKFLKEVCAHLGVMAVADEVEKRYHPVWQMIIAFNISYGSRRLYTKLTLQIRVALLKKPVIYGRLGWKLYTHPKLPL